MKDKKPTTLREELKDKLTTEELSLVPSSFDVVGDMLIFVDFPKELEKKEKLVGNAALKLYRHIKVVMKKTKNYSGKFRTPKLKIIAGEKRKETVHKENGVLLKLNVEKVYFSTRSATERKRISELVKAGESILVMFSGCGPFVFVIAKNTKAKEVYGVEINPAAHKYALENLKLSKSTNVFLYNGDARKIVPSLKKMFDRIIMPLPKSAEDFLGVAILVARKNCTIHFYDFLREEEIPNAAVVKIEKACKAKKKKFEIIRTVKCGQFSPSTFRTCTDFVIK